MSGLLFIPQTLLDGWIRDGRVDVTAAGLDLLEEGRTLPLEAACRFVGLLDGEDAAGLLDRVKTEPQLRELRAEPCGDSVLLGEVVYEVVPGFVARTPSADPVLRTPRTGFIEADATVGGARASKGTPAPQRAVSIQGEGALAADEEEVDLPAGFFSDDG